MEDRRYMKTATVTWYHFENFGTALQAYAMQRVVTDAGFENDIIAYKSNSHEVKNSERLTLKIILKKIFSKIYRIPEVFYKKTFYRSYAKRSMLFKDFIDEHLSLSRECRNQEDFERIDKEYDKFLCGSDQIWSPALFDSVFFLEFVKGNYRKIAYGPSLGRNFIGEEIKEKFKECVNNVHFLSVRENTGAKLLKDLTGREATIVLDPTLLVDSSRWKSIAVRPTVKREYILCYFLGDNKFPYQYLKRFNPNKQYEVVIITEKISDMRKPGFNVVEAGPSEFIGYCENARYIFTDSFHGIIFSILFKKQFFSFLRFVDKAPESQNSRVYNILQTFGLMDRLVLSFERNKKEVEKRKKQDIDYIIMGKKIEKERQKSLSYLINALKSNEIQINEIGKEAVR